MTTRTNLEIAGAVFVFLALAMVGRGQEVAMGEIKFNSGQSVQPAYEGWTRNKDGSRSMWFGYMNRNWEETPDIPTGPNNGFGPTGEDLGQPTHFLPRRQAFIFKVNVPADWPVDKDLIWTVTANGTTLKAFGSLWPVWEIDEQTMSANNGGRTARTFGEPVNLPPTISSPLSPQSIAVGQPLTLVLPVKDDGLPTPEIRARGTGGPRVGRGAGATGDGCARSACRSGTRTVRRDGFIPRSWTGEDRAEGICGHRRWTAANSTKENRPPRSRSTRPGSLHAARVRNGRRCVLVN